ncbi:MAG: pyridoxamine 5'-phosphate oxidase family protein [Candidatus Aminicenantes bacterium]|nr:pyridoxamine 5'-phosphate oxidase family protein [Candidatus Aminicenantes bacterium]
MTDEMTEFRKRIIELINQAGYASFATITEDGKPWVRFVSPRASEDMTLRFATFVNSRKVRQIAKHSEVHLTMSVGSAGTMTYLQIQGIARVTDDLAELTAYWKPEMAEYFKGPDDPQYRIVIIEPYRVEVNLPGQVEPLVWGIPVVKL